MCVCVCACVCARACVCEGVHVWVHVWLAGCVAYAFTSTHSNYPNNQVNCFCSRLVLTLYTRILILFTWHSIVKSKWRRTEEVRLTTFLCFLTPFHERMMKMWSALFDASIQEDVDSPLFLFEMASGLWLSGRTKYMLTTSTTLLWTGWRWQLLKIHGSKRSVLN